ncbi:MAG: PEP-CTERM sorting domain-containing protein [Verrucomicrobia bacterium]|nr:PEP-CTERM sorting domain-containing protein [Verrucomicrobiota bacterium]
MKKLIILLSALTVSTVISTRADILAQWTFEINTPADLADSTTISGIAADIGSGTASGVHASAVSDWSTPAGNGSANSLSVNNWGVGDYFQFQVSTVGYTGIGLSFDQTSSSTGPRDFELAYSTDGSLFTVHSPYTVLQNGLTPNASWNNTTASSAYSFAFDLSAVSALDNQATVYFRLVNSSDTAVNGNPVALTGTDRVDNFTVLSPVPEPSTAVLAILGGLLGFAFLRRKR